MSPELAPEAARRSELHRPATLLDLVDRILDKGAVVRGQIVLSVAEVDLVKLDLSLLLGAVETLEGGRP